MFFKTSKSRPVAQELQTDLARLARPIGQQDHCPITLEPILSLPPSERSLFIDGHYYKRSALMRWLSQDARSPLTNLPMTIYETRYGINAPATISRQTRCGDALKLKRSIVLFFCCLCLSSLLTLGQYPLSNKTSQTILSVFLFALFLVSACCFCFFPWHTHQSQDPNTQNAETRFAPFLLTGPTLNLAIDTPDPLNSPSGPLSFSHQGS